MLQVEGVNSARDTFISGNIGSTWNSWAASGQYSSYTETTDVRAGLLAEVRLPANASSDVIKKAYHHFLLTAHPDKGGDKDAFADKHQKWLNFL